MTRKTDDAPVTVEQCDRDDCADFAVMTGRITARDAAAMRNGEWDATGDVRFFAERRHRLRLAALASAPAGLTANTMDVVEGVCAPMKALSPNYDPLNPLVRDNLARWILDGWTNGNVQWEFASEPMQAMAEYAARAVVDGIRADMESNEPASAPAGDGVDAKDCGAVGEEAIRHLEIRSQLNRVIYRAVRSYDMSNMCDADDPSWPFPLVDLMSNDPPAGIGTGEMEMVYLADEIEAAITAAALARPRAAVEPVDCERCCGNGEIVTDWDRYKHAHEGDKGDEAVADCPDCDGTGKVDSPRAAVGEREA